MSNLWRVVLAAGESKRFKEAGYTTPKPFLRIRDSIGLSMPMIVHVVSNLPPVGDKDFYRTVVALPIGTEYGFGPTTKYIETTKGQADTVLQIVKNLPHEDSILVLDCDTILQTKDIQKLIEMNSVYGVTLAVTETFDPNVSRVDQVPFPTMFVEKEPISQYGIIGARCFRSNLLLIEALEEVMKECAETGKEPYLSMALNHYPGTKFALVIDKFEDWGTPERIKESGAEIIHEDRT